MSDIRAYIQLITNDLKTYENIFSRMKNFSGSFKKFYKSFRQLLITISSDNLNSSEESLFLKPNQSYEIIMHTACLISIHDVTVVDVTPDLVILPDVSLQNEIIMLSNDMYDYFQTNVCFSM